MCSPRRNPERFRPKAASGSMQTRCRRAGHITLNTFRETRDYHSVAHLMQCPSNPKDACPFCDKAEDKLLIFCG
jgi:hypothetical protein